MTALVASSETNGASPAPPLGANTGVTARAVASNVFAVTQRDPITSTLVATVAADWQVVQDWSIIHNQVFRVPVGMLVDSPFQPAERFQYRYAPEEIRQLAALMAEQGQVDKLLVRWVDGRFELIAGHRRLRAAEMLRWEHLDVLVVLMDDVHAHLTCRMHNFGRVEPSDYERARLYRELLDQHHGAGRLTQSMLAQIAGYTQGTVSKLLSMLALPAPILTLLDETPTLFGHNAAAAIARLVTEHPAEIELITEAVARLKTGAEQQSIRGWVKQMLAQRSGAKPQGKDRKHFVVGADNTALITATVVGRCVRLQVNSARLPVQDVLERAVRLLQKELLSDEMVANEQ